MHEEIMILQQQHLPDSLWPFFNYNLTDDQNWVLQGVPRQSVRLYTVFSVGYRDIYDFLWYIVCSKHHNVLLG